MVKADKANTQKEDFRFIQTIIQEGSVIAAINPLFDLYNQIRVLYESLELPTPEIYELFKDAQAAIYSKAKQLDREEVLELYSFLSNFCIKQMNLGIAVYRERLFLVYNDLLNLKYYGQQNNQTSLPPQIYKNMVSMAILLQENPLYKTLQTIYLPKYKEEGFPNGLVWAERFVAIYKNKLDKKFRKIYSTYCAALLSFVQGNHLKAYRQLGDPTHVKGKFLPFDVKTLQLRILYEVYLIDSERLDKDKVSIQKIMGRLRKKITYERNVKQELKYQLQQYIDFEQCFKALMKFHAHYYGRLMKSSDANYLADSTQLKDLIAACSQPYQGWFKEKMNTL